MARGTHENKLRPDQRSPFAQGAQSLASGLLRIKSAAVVNDH